VVGTSFEDNTNEGFRVQGQQFPTEYFKYITSAANVSSGTSNRSDWGLVSYFGRLSYTFDDRITTTFNVRHDGSSRFGEDNRYGTFPSASVLWRVGDESFMQEPGIFGNLALRASYGLTGNQQDLGNFASRGLFGGGFNYNDQPGIAPSQLANPNLRWEKTKQLNLGHGLLRAANRLLFTVDYYDKQTEDLLVARPVPRTTGFTSIWDNVGSMQNKGFEVAATAQLLRAAAAGRLQLDQHAEPVAQPQQGHGAVQRPAVRRHEPRRGGQAAGLLLRLRHGRHLPERYEEIAGARRQVVHSDPRRATAPGDIRFKDINGRTNGNLNGEPTASSTPTTAP
jgi:outer membrane receptor protein involved in Fe transport